MDYKTITRNCHYYEIGHLSCVIKPGAYRIKTESNTDSDIRHTAFVNADGSYAVVVVNKSDAMKNISIADGTHRFVCTLPAKAAASLRWN
jgi:glucosylceramidase